MSATVQRPTAARERITDDELARLRRKVDGGETLSDPEATALLAEMERATAATQPATAALQSAIEVAGSQRGKALGFVEVEVLWGTIPGLRAVKRLYDRERAHWRRANDILRESDVLLSGDPIPAERRAPHPVDPSVPSELDHRRRKRPWRS